MAQVSRTKGNSCGDFWTAEPWWPWSGIKCHYFCHSLTASGLHLWSEICSSCKGVKSYWVKGCNLRNQKWLLLISLLCRIRKGWNRGELASSPGVTNERGIHLKSCYPSCGKCAMFPLRTKWSIKERHLSNGNNEGEGKGADVVVVTAGHFREPLRSFLGTCPNASHVSPWSILTTTPKVRCRHDLHGGWEESLSLPHI